ncbi:hydantoinase/oxoprolinase family protein [Mesorhizobium sp. YM1C-6-2]|uniref:hydantoinase/oxoprolinase family protein n=1 Tax=Mesorhizobium sp. YM1C-6-2 TaxID=1827501 RepID=UPI000EF2829E|nr:hydantoinase/oxoprolinase family protein [Mesorhizobium sp. YM1C-6-2]RLP24042.1 hydantoinase/oxoprolinase family protein [Mesorhizobium sp. YM1C-6-2]
MTGTTATGSRFAQRIAIDIGGTFTDLALIDGEGVVVTHKRLTTPRNPVEGFVSGVSELLELAGISPDLVHEIRHATTLGSNVVIERLGAPVAFLTTKGFGDVLQIQKAVRYSIYDTRMRKPEPLVPRSRVWEVNERVMASGEVLRPLDAKEARRIVSEIRASGARAVAVGFLHSYANPLHEEQMKELFAQEAPEIYVTLSSEVSQLAKEYARFNTAVTNAYLTPIFRDYLSRLGAALQERSIEAPLWIMQSSGGLTSSERAAALPVRSVESGPTAGVTMAARRSSMSGFENVISFDMGGTTAKASIVTNGRPTISRSFEIDRLEMRDGSGLPLDTLAVDLIEIGSGGGSIAQLLAGALQVGPRSAASEPGPVCYARGGTEPTVTDAALVLGYLDPASFAGGAIRLDRDGAVKALARLGEPLGLDALQTAWGVHQLVCLNMERATRLISIDKGLDPRDYAMICFGGAGPVHAARLARGLGVKNMIVPAGAGVGSALGLLSSVEKTELARTRKILLDGGCVEKVARQIFEELRRQAAAMMGCEPDDPRLSAHHFVGLRYSGQGYELEVELPSVWDEGLGAKLRDAFARLYSNVYGYAEDLPLEATTWRIALESVGQDIEERLSVERSEGGRALKGRRTAYFGETGETQINVYDRHAMSGDDRAIGPCVIEERDTTTVLLPGDIGRIDERGAIIVEIGKAAQ